MTFSPRCLHGGRKRPPYLPVDRVFALPGHGTIVTGTLMQGVISSGDTLALQPSGLRARVKSLQIFGARVSSAGGGSRLAVNIPGVDVSQIGRGEALVAAREFEPARELKVDFFALPSALPMLRRRMPVRVHIGSAEIPGQLRFSGAPPLDGAASPAQVLLWRPAVFYPGLRIIVRRMSPKDLLGGAIVRGAVAEQIAAGNGELQIAAGDTADETRFDRDFDGAPTGAAEVLDVVSASGLTPLSVARIATRANIAQWLAETALAWLLEHGRVASLERPAEFVSREAFETAFARVMAAVRERHAQSPWQLGISPREAASSLDVPEPLALRLLHAWREDGRVAVRSGIWHAPDFAPALNKAQAKFFEDHLAVPAGEPYLPHSYEAIARKAAERSPDLSEALASLIAVGAFVRVGDDLYRRSQIEQRARGDRSVHRRQGLGDHGAAAGCARDFA